MNYTTVTPESEEDWRNFVFYAQRVFDYLHIDYDEFVSDLPVSIIFEAADDHEPDLQISLSSAAHEEFRNNYGYVRAGVTEMSEWK